MAAYQHAPGAIHHFVAFRNAPSSYLYLGTAEVAPEVEADIAYLPVMNDLRGRSKPFNLVFDGESHAVFSTLNRFDYPVWKRCRDAIGHDATLSTLGREGRLENGNLVLGTGDFELVLAYDFAGTAAATADLPNGRRYYSGVVGGWKESTQGTRVMSVAVRFDCNSLWNYGAGRTHDLFTEDLSGLTLTLN